MTHIPFEFFKTRNTRNPERGTPESAGIDFFVPWDSPTDFYLAPGQDILIPTGIHVKFPATHYLRFENKSGVCTKRKLMLGAGTIDADYQGEVHIHVFNMGQEAVNIFPGMKLIQGVLVRCSLPEPKETKFETLEEFYGETSERGEGGFGSTGI